MKKNLMIFRNKKAMAKISFAILGIISLFLAVMFVSGVGGVENDYDEILILENKNPSWEPIIDGIKATLYYNEVGEMFEYKLIASGLQSETDYSLIYYADKPERFTNWGGNNPGALIDAATSGSDGSLSMEDSKDLGMNLPSLPDANIDQYCYATSGTGEITGDNYDTCHGAKIWLVPTNALPDPYPHEISNEAGWDFWKPHIQPEILFETDLINTYPECIPGEERNYGEGACAETQVCQEGGIWETYEKEGNLCGTCKPFGCNLDAFSFTVEIFTSGEKTCDVEGICSSDSCVYRHECADDDLDDGWPNHEIEPVSCHAECDQDEDCSAYCVDDVLHSNGVCPLISCTCENYETYDCNQDDGWDDTGNTRWVDNEKDQCTEKEQKEQEWRDYSCIESLDPADCGYTVTNNKWVDTENTRPAYEGDPCNDGLFCTDIDICTNGECVGGARDCSDDVVCTDDSCDEDTDSCDNVVNDGNCDDQVSCTNDKCDAQLDCQYTPEDSICDNDLWCDGFETCDTLGGCLPGTAQDPDDGVDCTDDSCDEENDIIVHAVNDEYCNDENECTDDTCDATADCENTNKPKDTPCGSIKDCLDNTCSGPFGEFFPIDGHDTCDGAGICIEYSCERIDSYCCDNDEFDKINGLFCGAQCDQDSDCETGLVGTTCFYDSEGCDLASTCSCGYTEEDCEPGVDNQGMCHWGTQECVDVNGCTLNVEELEVGEICDPDLGPVVIIDLVEGWNLISIPIVPEESTAIADVLGNANVSRVYAYDPLISGDSGWLVYNGGGSLTFMTAGYGYWIYADSDTEIKVKGDLINEPNGNPTAPPSRNLVAGWNLIGHYGLDEKPIGDALYSLRNKMHGLDTWNAIWPAETSGNMLSGQGYWLAIDGSLTVYTPNI